MPGSHNARPATLTPRTGRKPRSAEQLEQIALDESEHHAVFPESVIYVDGRVRVTDWTGKRHLLAQLDRAAIAMGLSLQEIDPYGSPTQRRNYFTPVDMLDAYFVILEQPGLSIRAWAKLAYPEPPEANPAVIAANFRRATAGLVRLTAQGYVRKLKNADHLVVLWPLRSLHNIKPPPIPAALLALRANQPR